MKYGPYTTQNVTWDTVIFDGQTIFLAAVAYDRPANWLLVGMPRVLTGVLCVLCRFGSSMDDGFCMPSRAAPSCQKYVRRDMKYRPYATFKCDKGSRHNFFATVAYDRFPPHFHRYNT